MPVPDHEPKCFEVALFDFGGVFIDSPFPAFRQACRRKGLDDLQQNLDVDESVGMHGILVNPDPASAMQDLKRLVTGE
ncbi:MAG: hypothetical protein JRG80_19110 [Deltaproteobacteria bacterium]|nr:hypothetical protein [Deltaproteobacteria bacterium]MBW2401335.1 hypothetical protein [Deltaproteobacteria bacterium]